MKKVLLLGINGTFGGHVARALLEKGYAVRALMRDPAKHPSDIAGVEVLQGDVADLASLRRAAEGMDAMVYGVNPPNYDWKDKALPWLENAALVAEERGMTVIFPGNVYQYDPKDGPDFDEAVPPHPRGDMGALRLAMERRLQRASENGARVIILRAGDYIAAGARSAWLNVLLTSTARGYRLGRPGPADIAHTWAYVPDMARTAVALMERADTLSAFNLFHFRGYRLSLRELAEAVEAFSGRPVRLYTFPWFALRLVAPFSVMFRGLLQMRYLWQEELNLVDDKLRQTLGDELQHTPLQQALLESGLVTPDESAAPLAVR